MHPIRVSVLINLELVPEAGGHVKCWERFAAAAAALDGELDLTLHVLGEENTRRQVADNVRYVVHRPVLSTRRLSFLRVPDHTDLAPFHRGLRQALNGADVLHTTEPCFAFTETAARHSRRTGTPLVHSTHTDTVKYTRIFTENAIRRLGGASALTRLLIQRLRMPDYLAGLISGRFRKHLRRCAYGLGSSDADYDLIVQELGWGRAGRLRRGIDLEFFHPGHRDRAKLEHNYGLPAGRFLVLFAGRVDDSKSPLVLAEAVLRLAEKGIPIHALFAGRGGQRAAVAEKLGPLATICGPVSQETLRSLYAGADLFVFPSTTEVHPNVVCEAMASGLPVVVSAEGGSAGAVARPGIDGLGITSHDPAVWAAAVEGLWRDGEWRRDMAQAARRRAESDFPSWSDVLREDLLPAWHAAAAGRRELAPVFLPAMSRFAAPLEKR